MEGIKYNIQYTAPTIKYAKYLIMIILFDDYKVKKKYDKLPYMVLNLPVM